VGEQVHTPPRQESVALRVELVRGEGERAELRFFGALVLPNADVLWRELERLGRELRAPAHLDFALAQADRVDGVGMAFLVHARSELHRRGISSEFVGATPQVEELIRLYRGDEPLEPPKSPAAKSAFAQIGDATLTVLREAQFALGFFGQLLVELRAALRSPRTANVRDIPPIMERVGADALPIVLLVNFLVGLVMAFQASVQLKRFGANMLVADLIGISMTRELGPLMTAIVVCGRSGAAFAAELGTMAVNDEIDALRVMQVSPMRYLVLPRVVGMFLVLPILAFFADLMGVLGGLLVGMTRLDLTFVGYVNQTFRAVRLWDVYSGAIKAGVFAFAIGLVACEQGLAAVGGAEAVGKRTTTAVVAGLFTLILIDAVFTVAFRLTGL
jgi:phospholipid/cholesterol/gamma-HCH transport system permease protein